MFSLVERKENKWWDQGVFFPNPPKSFLYKTERKLRGKNSWNEFSKKPLKFTFKSPMGWLFMFYFLIFSSFVTDMLTFFPLLFTRWFSFFLFFPSFYFLCSFFCFCFCAHIFIFLLILVFFLFSFFFFFGKHFVMLFFFLYFN